jgi:hypothetical protein
MAVVSRTYAAFSSSSYSKSPNRAIVKSKRVLSDTGTAYDAGGAPIDHGIPDAAGIVVTAVARA